MAAPTGQAGEAGDGIRPAVEGDAPALLRIDRQTSVRAGSLERYQGVCDGRGSEKALVFEQGGEVIGFVLYSIVLDEASVHNIAICPSRQGRGQGAALMRAALDEMCSGGAVRCLLEVRESNVAARGLYDRLGFRLDGRRPRYYRTRSGREDALLMSLNL